MRKIFASACVLLSLVAGSQIRSRLRQSSTTKTLDGSTWTQDGQDVYITPSGTPVRTLIIIHGLGGNGIDQCGSYFGNEDDSSLLQYADTSRVICPTAPLAANDLNPEGLTNSWFNIISVDPPTQVFGETEADTHIQHVIDIINKEVATYYNGDYSKIYLQGSSQGGFLSWNVALVIPQTVGGVATEHGEIFPHIQARINSGTLSISADKKANLKLMAYAGLADDTIPEWGTRQSIVNMRNSGYKKVEYFVEEEEPHTITDQEEKVCNDHLFAWFEGQQYAGADFTNMTTLPADPTSSGTFMFSASNPTAGGDDSDDSDGSDDSSDAATDDSADDSADASDSDSDDSD